MRRLVLTEANPDISKAKIEVQEVDTPIAKRGQVLVKVTAAAINPSDDGTWRVKPRSGYPMALGNEGSGTVVASGGGFFANRLVGKNVAITGKTYAEYAVVDAFSEAFTLPKTVPVEDGCSFFVNPFTVVGIVDTALSCGGKAFIHTAAASTLGQMMVKYCLCEGVKVVNVVRRKEQADMLRALGAEFVVVTTDDDWKSQLSALIKKLEIKCAFDAVSGDMTGDLLTMMPPRGKVYVYGRLAPEPLGNIQPLDLIYRGKEVKGFLLTGWLMQGGMIRALIRTIRTANIVRKYLDTVFASPFKDTSLKDMQADYSSLQASGATGTKMRLRPGA